MTSLASSTSQRGIRLLVIVACGACLTASCRSNDDPGGPGDGSTSPPNESGDVLSDATSNRPDGVGDDSLRDTDSFVRDADDAASPADPTDSSGDEMVDGADRRDAPTGGELGVQLGTSNFSERTFEPYADSGATFELVRGRQGGIHLEPVVRMTGVVRSDFETKVVFEIRERPSGEVMSREANFEFGSRVWYEGAGGHLLYSPPVVFKVWEPDEVAGTKVTLEVELTLEGRGDTVRASVDGVVADPES